MRPALVALLAGLGTLTGAARLTAADPPRPSVLLVLADDMGFSDAGCYGGEIRTPHLDKLAATGLRFTQFYNTARCWPTRAAVLTGYYPQQVRRDTVPGIPSGTRGVRPAWAVLLPELLRPLGYRSYSLNDHDRHFAPKQHTEDDKPLPPADAKAGYYSSTAIADHAVKCLTDHKAKFADRPFFHFLAFTAPHFPLQAPPEDVAKYETAYLAGWEEVRAKRWEKLKALPLRGASLSPTERDVGPPYPFPEAMKKLGPDEVNRPLPWADLTPEQRRFQANKMAVHAAMVDRMDRELGRVLAALPDPANTLVVFLSDNGASAEIMVRGDGHDPHAACGTGATFVCLGPGWSGVANTPFRRHKTWVHEGGIATPFLVSWPKGIAARGELRTPPGHVIDLVPTVLELAGGKPGNGPPLPGKSLVPAFASDVAIQREPIWWLHEGNRALRAGDWKIVAAGKGSAWELYDLAADRSETKNLAAGQPAKVAELADIWEKRFEVYKADAK